MALLVPALGEVLRAFPGLELAFLRGTAAEVMEHRKKGDAALAVAGPIGEAWERLDAWPLFSEPFRVLVGATHRLSGRSRLTLEDIRAERVLARPFCELAAAFEAFARDHGIFQTGWHCVACEQDLVALVGAGVGIGIVPRSIPCSPELCALEADGLELARTVSLYAVAGRERAPPATALMKLLRARDWSAMAA
jgi:DNA-binding transcriptional LysR family regulator